MHKRYSKYLVLLPVLLILGVAYMLAYQTGEPFYNNDETRHVMTGVYFRDLLHDMPLGNLRGYTISYYLQYPALGLLVWPPFFYILEGLTMSIFGTSLVVSKMLIGLFAVLGCAYLFRLVRRSHDGTRAAIAVLFFGLSPLVFELSHYVMLEVPTLALGLAATYHFVSFMEGEERRRDLLLAALFSVLTALTRFDAVYLLPLFLIMLALRGRWMILRRRDVWAVSLVALLLVAPFFALSASSIGWSHFKYMTETLSPSDPGFLSLKRLFFYPSYLPEQLGWPMLCAALVGIICGLRSERRERTWIYLALIAATYVTFTPMGELGSRHTIYWIPAFAFFAADGVALVAQWLRVLRLYPLLAGCVLAFVLWGTLAKPLLSLRGYEEAARHVAANSTDSPYCLFVGSLNGDFIYQLRRQDPQRRLWVLRADKLLFSVLIVPGVQYKQLAASDEDILATIYKYDPGFIVMEEPRPSEIESAHEEERLRSEFESQVRTVISNHPERFSLEKVVAVNTKDPVYQGTSLKVFRNTLRNENPERRLDVEILMLRQSVQTVVP
jgi:hypothetical protein